MENTNQQLAEFQNLLEEIRREFKKLHQLNLTLRDENEQLRTENTALKAQDDLFSGVPEKKKLLMKQQIETLMDKIDQQMEDLK